MEKESLNTLEVINMSHNLIAVDKGALQIALNVLYRGTEVQREVADELKKTVVEIEDVILETNNISSKIADIRASIKLINIDNAVKEELPHHPV